MGIQTVGFHGSGLQSHLQPPERQNSWYRLTLDEVESQLGDLGKPLASMNIDELLNNVWEAEANQAIAMDIDNASSASALQRQASQTLVRSFSGRTVNEVWREIKQGQKVMRDCEGMKSQEIEPTLGETTLEDFLVKAGLFVAEAFLGPSMALDSALAPEATPQMALSPSTSIDALSDAPTPGQKRYDGDAVDKTLDRRLKRKIKNRESAARSRARRQAYQNELVIKVSRLEEENMKLRKEKELDETMPCELDAETRYQLRRTSSF